MTDGVENNLREGFESKFVQQNFLILYFYYIEVNYI